MAKSGIVLSRKTRDELSKASKSVSAVPVLKSRLLEVIDGKIESSKVEELLQKPEMVAKLQEEEALRYIAGLYKTTLSESLNPVSVFITNKEVKSSISKELYNEEFKDKFMSRYNESTQRVVRILFKKTATLERAYGKDLYDFSLDEFQDVLKSLEAKTIRSLQSSVVRIRQYISFALEEGVAKENVNYADMFGNASRIEPFLSEKAEDIVFSRQELMSMALHADNAQDGALIAVMFDGMNNKNQSYEIINLKNRDVDLDNQTILVRGKDKDRIINLSTETCILLRDAMEQDEYIGIQGDQYRKYKLLDSEYVFRGIRNNPQIKWRNINDRISRIGKANDEELNPTNIIYSGQLYYLKNILQEHPMETALRLTLEYFGLPANESSAHNLKKRFERFGKKL